MGDLTGRAVMVLEDQFYLAMDVKAALDRAGANVIGPFSTSAEALDSVADQVPDCAILDVNLGEGASYDLARDLRRRGIPFLFFTGYDASAIPDEFAMVPRLQKPVEPVRLVSAVRDM